MNIIEQLEQEQKREKELPEFAPGDTVQVSVRVREGERERVQVFEGVVIAMRSRGLGSSFTVRKISYGEGVERVFQTHSPLVDGVKVKSRGRVRRAKLYYLRSLRGRSARIKEKLPQSAKRASGAGDASGSGKSGKSGKSSKSAKSGEGSE